jgi:hypothetical protein
MKKYLVLILLILTFASCKKRHKINEQSNFIKDSYKTQKENGDLKGKTDNYDSINNIYSNYKYCIAYDAPKYWIRDNGVSDHTILRTFDKDSSIGIVINVIETTYSPNKNIWDIYDQNPIQLENQFKQSIQTKINSKLIEYSVEKSYIKNIPSLKRKFIHTIKDLDFVYDNVNIIQQSIRGKYFYTFSVFVPKMFYDNNPKYYDNLFLNLYFLNCNNTN